MISKTKHLALVPVLALLFASCGNDPKPAADSFSASQKLLEPYRDAVRALVNPWDENDLDEHEFTIAASKLADEHILKVTDELHELAIRMLEAEKEIEIDYDDYEERLVSEFDVTDLLGPSEKRQMHGALVFKFWDPFRSANEFRLQTLSSEFGHAVVSYFLRENIAPSITSVLVKDPIAPVVAIRSGDELCVVSLEYNELGFYTMKTIRFLTKKG